MVQLGGLSWVNTTLLVQSCSYKMSEHNKIAHESLKKMSLFGAAAATRSLLYESKLTHKTDTGIAHSSEFLFPLKQSINHMFPHPERLLINAPSFHFPLVRVNLCNQEMSLAVDQSSQALCPATFLYATVRLEMRWAGWE